ncbi:MAG: heavy metal translocating P-type ATPase [Patescibacteria group bacterium]|nr:heavy metal translocating P-type ATPase [Patescibacteria group bacterium]
MKKIIELVEKSQQNKAKINTTADKFAKWYIILTLIGSIALYAFTQNLGLILAVLLVSCADDVAVAIPLAFMAAITTSARKGVIIKGGDFVEGLNNLKTIVVDKTGTLTKGKLKVVKFVIFDGQEEREILGMAGSTAELSSHPAAQAIVNYLKEKNLSFREPDKYNELGGKGAEAIYGNKKFISGELAYLQELGIKIAPEQLCAIKQEENNGFNVTLSDYDGKLAALFALTDELRPKIKETIADFKNLGINQIVMLTGDNEKIAQRVSNETGIKEYHVNLLPEDKIRYLKKYINKKSKTAMIGDGVSDAAALSLADIGIAMGAIGSDAAIESADIALMKDDFEDIPNLIKLGYKTMNIVKQDLIIWGTVNIVGLVLVFGGIIGPSGAAAYNFITDFFPLFNSFRLFK